MVFTKNNFCNFITMEVLRMIAFFVSLAFVWKLRGKWQWMFIFSLVVSVIYGEGKLQQFAFTYLFLLGIKYIIKSMIIMSDECDVPSYKYCPYCGKALSDKGMCATC